MLQDLDNLISRYIYDIYKEEPEFIKKKEKLFIDQNHLPTYSNYCIFLDNDSDLKLVNNDIENFIDNLIKKYPSLEKESIIVSNQTDKDTYSIQGYEIISYNKKKNKINFGLERIASAITKTTDIRLIPKFSSYHPNFKYCHKKLLILELNIDQNKNWEDIIDLLNKSRDYIQQIKKMNNKIQIHYTPLSRDLYFSFYRKAYLKHCELIQKIQEL
ncbi:hypothetical protein CPAV1605_1143 [seawater metagenome]|uniref:Uncharacterized protein n=1 Tax=seawater metagenome TaxID=1561972 RepID=A0A5E8CM56_9ZZZZ